MTSGFEARPPADSLPPDVFDIANLLLGRGRQARTAAAAEARASAAETFRRLYTDTALPGATRCCETPSHHADYGHMADGFRTGVSVSRGHRGLYC